LAFVLGVFLGTIFDIPTLATAAAALSFRRIRLVLISAVLVAGVSQAVVASTKYGYDFSWGGLGIRIAGQVAVAALLFWVMARFRGHKSSMATSGEPHAEVSPVANSPSGGQVSNAVERSGRRAEPSEPVASSSSELEVTSSAIPPNSRALNQRFRQHDGDENVAELPEVRQETVKPSIESESPSGDRKPRQSDQEQSEKKPPTRLINRTQPRLYQDFVYLPTEEDGFDLERGRPINVSRASSTIQGQAEPAKGPAVGGVKGAYERVALTAYASRLVEKIEAGDYDGAVKFARKRCGTHQLYAGMTGLVLLDVGVPELAERIGIQLPSEDSLAAMISASAGPRAGA